jgi:hypothetical protein
MGGRQGANFLGPSIRSKRLKGVVMTTEGHIAALERRHKELERQIDDERTHLSHDEMMIAALKRKKLEIKDELVKLQATAA